ncbi:MAG TPA: hypothetical protein VGG27_03455 [Magnetospirillaceae bacterium]
MSDTVSDGMGSDSADNARVPRRRRQGAGRVIGAAVTINPVPPHVAAKSTRLATFILILCLPMFGQTFQYLIDLFPFYALSKAWPLLALPLVVYAVSKLPLPYKPLYALTLIYVIVVTPTLSMFQLGNGFFDAMATTVKTWSFMNYFSLAALLFLLKPDVATLRKTMIGLGIATFIIMIALWLVEPHDAYVQNQNQSKLLIYDDRGYHIYMPMFFGMFYVFYLNRRLWLERHWISGVLLVITCASLIAIYKERTALIAGAVAIVYGAAFSLSRAKRIPLIAVGMVGGMIGAFFAIRHLIDQLSSSLGASLSVRQETAALIYSYVTDQPLRWVFGVGSITRFSTTTLRDLFQDKHFFLADVGWLGTLFEYGIIGTVLIILVYVSGIRLARQAAASGDAEKPFRAALADYAVYLMVVSTIYSAVFTPGEVATISAIAIYCTGLRRRLLNDETAPLAEAPLEKESSVPSPTTGSRQRRRTVLDLQAPADRLA